MMLKWSKRAVGDLAQIKSFIHKGNPSAAKQVALELAALAQSLIEHPSKGRTGRLPNTRELIAPSLPYIIIYRARANQIEILRLIHTSQRWPQ